MKSEREKTHWIRDAEDTAKAIRLCLWFLVGWIAFGITIFFLIE